ncbi:MAG: class II aldolase/adducin family protein [Candidatus Nezhaarchaeota archaeon]|nr:class II aldolase/adducin family protein [Candidatus Nezhaarchaeota archaeon]
MPSARIPSSLSSEEALKREICRTMARLYFRGLISALSGNASARLLEAKEFWITPSGVFKGGLRPRDLVKVDLYGNVVEGSMRPSIEAPLHAVIYRKRSDVNAVVHSHSPITVGLASAGLGARLIAETAPPMGEVKILPWAPPGTAELARLVEKNVDDAKALVLVDHGVVGVGRNLLEAEEVVESLELASLAQLVALMLKKNGPSSRLR